MLKKHKPLYPSSPLSPHPPYFNPEKRTKILTLISFPGYGYGLCLVGLVINFNFSSGVAVLLILSLLSSYWKKNSGMEQEKYQEMNGSESASEVESPYASKGLNLGKMILMAGLVFSSAPVVVPGVIVVSAIGFACSVPYGLFLATHSFTQTLLTKLIPLRTVIDTVGDESLGMYGQKNLNEDETAEEDGYGEDDEEARSVVVEGENGQEKNEKLEKEAPSKESEAEALKNEDKTADAPSEETEHGTTTGPSEDAAVSQSVAENEGGGDANQDDADVASTEVVNDEEKLWEQMDGLRAIVGYSGSRHSTCLEELVALYVFVGIELERPAASLSDPRDLVVYLNAKLGDLKLIVGVK